MSEPSRTGDRIPLTILGGYLGAGKSTWLRHQLHEGFFGRARLIVNEAADIPVDNHLLTKAHRIEVLAGGCACCEDKAGFIAMLRRICGDCDANPEEATDCIVLETSGLADPGTIASALAEDQLLGRRLILQRTIVLVDALHGPVQLAEDELVRRQIEAADIIIVTKQTGAPPIQLARLLSTLRHCNPEAEIQGAEHGVRQDLPSDTTAEPYTLPSPSGACEPIAACSLDVSQGGWANLSVWLSALLAARGDDIVRVKGIVKTPAGRLLLQSVRQTVQPPEILPEPTDDVGPLPGDDRIVLIGRNFDEALINRSWRAFVLP